MNAPKDSKDTASATKPPKPVNRIALYVSSYSQDGTYVASQERRLREFVESRNRHGKLGEVVEVFRDHGSHYDTFTRPGFQALQRAIRRKDVTLVIVPELRDLTASQRDLPRVLRLFLRHNCGLRSLNEYLIYEILREEPEQTAAGGEL